MRDFGAEAQRAAQLHLDACFTAMYAYEDGDDLDWRSPASAPFDGCEKCSLREALYAAWPFVYESVKSDFYKNLGRYAEIVAQEDDSAKELAWIASLSNSLGDFMWSDERIDRECRNGHGGHPPGATICAVCGEKLDAGLADGVGAEQEDQPDRDGDGDEREFTGSECHALRLPPDPDVSDVSAVELYEMIRRARETDDFGPEATKAILLLAARARIAEREEMRLGRQQTLLERWLLEARARIAELEAQA